MIYIQLVKKKCWNAPVRNEGSKESFHKSPTRNVMSSRWWRLVVRGASQIMCPIMSYPPMDLHTKTLSKRKTSLKTPSSNTKQQACGLSQTQRCKKDLGGRLHQPQMCDEMLRIIGKNGDFPPLQIAVFCLVPFSSSLFSKRTSQLCLSICFFPGTPQKSHKLKRENLPSNPTKPNQPSTPPNIFHLEKKNPTITSRCSIEAGAPYLNVVHAWEVSVEATEATSWSMEDGLVPGMAITITAVPGIFGVLE